VNWGTLAAFLAGGVTGAVLLALLERGANDRSRRAHILAHDEAIRYAALLHYVATKGLRCPEGAKYGAWLQLVEAVMVKERVNGVREQ
jgi:hypothetical protein